jgi:undecaprenyl-diphosphatase
LDVGFADFSYTQVAILGVVQGLTELLPISSTAHMRVVPALLGWPDPGAAFSAAMQSAALLAVISYFWRDVAEIVGGSWRAARQRRFDDPNIRMAGLIVVATIPIGVVGLLLAPLLNACNSPLRSLPVVGAACLMMALLLAWAEAGARHARTMATAGIADGLAVGVAQIGALIPGVSRSGSTLTAALALGFKRAEAARFSFLIGLPAIALAGGKEFLELHRAHLPAHGWAVLSVGLVFGALSSFIAIWTLMRVLERFSAWPFVVYRAVLGVVLIGGAFAGLLH